jgi:hypothetical protein
MAFHYLGYVFRCGCTLYVILCLDAVHACSASVPMCSCVWSFLEHCLITVGSSDLARLFQLLNLLTPRLSAVTLGLCKGQSAQTDLCWLVWFPIILFDSRFDFPCVQHICVPFVVTLCL